MKTETKIYEHGLEEHPKSGAILGNILMILWIALGALGCWFLNPIVAWIYLVFAAAMVFIVLRWLVCTKCYYYDKWCPIGWGKLSALFFKRGNVEDFDKSIGVKLAPITYGLLTLVPLICIVVSMIQDFTIPKVIVLVVLLLLSIYSGAISRSRTCKKCKMRLACPGCAVKND